jgi:hypothetical protein
MRRRASQHSATYLQLIKSGKIKQSRLDRPRSGALIFRSAPSSIVVYRLKSFFHWSASLMPSLGFQRMTQGINLCDDLPHKHTNYTNFTMQNEQKIRQGNIHRPRAGNPLLPMLMCPVDNYNHENPFRNGRGGTSRSHAPCRLYESS